MHSTVFWKYPKLEELLKEAFRHSSRLDGRGSIDFGPDGMMIEGVRCVGTLSVHFHPGGGNKIGAYQPNEKERRTRDWRYVSILGGTDGRSLRISPHGITPSGTAHPSKLTG